MKIYNTTDEKAEVELSAEECSGLYSSILYVLDTLPGGDFEIILHFSKPVAFRLVKQLEDQVIPHLDSQLYDSIEETLEENSNNFVE